MIEAIIFVAALLVQAVVYGFGIWYGLKEVKRDLNILADQMAENTERLVNALTKIAKLEGRIGL